MSGNLYEIVKSVVYPVIEASGLDLIELNVSQKRRDLYIELLVDKPEGGIKLDQCTRLNKQIDELLEKEEMLAGQYFLEVCSPGIDRPLKTRKDFFRVQGKEIRVYIAVPVDGRLEHTGTVKTVDENNVTVTTAQGDAVIPLQQINKAVQVI